MSKKIALIDGYGFVFRAYHSLPPLTRPDGTPVGAVYGFTNMLIKLLAGLEVSHAAVVFDAGSKTFRNEIYPAYKANRPPCPEDLKPQFPIIRQTAESLNLAILEKIGFEADDLIATIAKKSAAQGYEVMIISSDKDLMQLVSEQIFMFDAMRNKFIGINEVKEKFSVLPGQVLDLLSLIGDASDNVPGIKGIGPKTAAELITQFQTLENLFANLDKIKQEKRRQVLFEGMNSAKLSKSLITLKDDVELALSLDDLAIKSLEPHKLLAFLEEQGFRSLISRVKKEFSISERALPAKTGFTDYNANETVSEISFDDIKRTEILSLETIREFSKQASLNGIVTIDYHSQNGQLDFIALSTNKQNEKVKEVFFAEISLPKNNLKDQDLDLFSFAQESDLGQQEKGFIVDELKKILQDGSIKKIFFNAKDFLKIFSIWEIALDDVSLINHLLHSATKNSLRELIQINLSDNIESRGFGEIFTEIEKNFTGKILDNSKKVEFFCFRNFSISQLHQIFYPQIFALKLNEAYFQYERPLLEVLARMELSGIKIDLQKLHDLSWEFEQKIRELTYEIHALAGQEFNIASPKQLAEILFDKLGLSSEKKSKKTGAISTSAEVLYGLCKEGHEIAKKILEFRKFSKLKNTYTDTLPQEVNPKTNRIHTSFSSISTVTGRLSSSHPNLQNIPIKDVEGQKIRQSFIAEKGHFLIAADYSQIELRVIAHIAKITNLINAFRDGKDIHKITASQVFDLPEEKIDGNLRSKAKAINFGIIYGISAFGLSRQLGISRSQASEYIKSYLETYPGIDIYMKNYIGFAREHGYVQTISGRKCFIREINNKNPALKAEAERLAINAPIQGSAADIIKKAIIHLDQELRERNFRSKILLQIHDELIVESPKEEVEIVASLVKQKMENALLLDVPLKVDMSISESWE